MSQAAKWIFHRYSRFHECFDDAVQRASRTLDLSVSFSDSGVVAASDMTSVISVAVEMMQESYKRRIPIRVGVAHGTLASLTFSHSSKATGQVSAQSQF